jgi:uroporphyrinogen decarboxylase
MTPRELLLRAFRCEPTNRVPVAPFVHANFVKAFHGSHEIDVVEKTIEVCEHFGFDIVHRNCTPIYDDVDLISDEWAVATQVQVDGRNRTTTRVIHTPGGDLREVSRLHWITEYDAEFTPIEYLIKSESDLDLLAAFMPPVGRIETEPIRKARDMLGDRGVTAPWIQGAFNHVAYYFRSVDDLILDAMLNPTFYSRMMEFFLERNMQTAAQLVEAGSDLLSYAGNIASGKMVGYDFFTQHVFDYEKRLIEFIQSRGTGVLYHNCGYARCLFPAYRDLGMRAYESLTPAPLGDTVLEEAFEAIPNVVLYGHLDQVELLRKASPDEIETAVGRIMEQAKKRGNFVLGTSDYLLEDTPHDSLHALAESGRRLGNY